MQQICVITCTGFSGDVTLPFDYVPQLREGVLATVDKIYLTVLTEIT